MGLIHWARDLFRGNGRRLGDEERLNAIKRIKAELMVLEKQWEQKEKEFTLKKVKRKDTSGSSWAVDAPRTLVFNFPYKHGKDIWRDFRKLSKKIRAIELLVAMRKSKETAALAKRDRRAIEQLGRIIEYEEASAARLLQRDIGKLLSAIDEGIRAEKKSVLAFFLQSKIEEVSDASLRYFDKNLEKMRRILIEDPNFFYGYSFDERMKFFDYLKAELQSFMERLSQLTYV